MNLYKIFDLDVRIYSKRWIIIITYYKYDTVLSFCFIVFIFASLHWRNESFMSKPVFTNDVKLWIRFKPSAIDAILKSHILNFLLR